MKHSYLMAIVVVTMSFGCKPSPSGFPQASTEKSASGGASVDGAGAFTTPEARMQEVVRLARSRQWARAQSLVQQHLVEFPNDVGAMELSGDLLVQQGEPTQAIKVYEVLVKQASPAPASLFHKLALQQMKLGRAIDALQNLETASALHPNHQQLHEDITGLAVLLGFSRAAVPHVKWLVLHGHSDFDSLILLADPHRVEADEERCRKAFEKHPADLRLQYGIAAHAVTDLRWQAAVDLLQPIVAKYPDFVPAYGLLGRALAELEDASAFQAWGAKQPAAVKENSDFWLAQARWADRHQRPAEAARSYWEAIRCDELSLSEAKLNLVGVLRQIGRTQEADRVGELNLLQVGIADALDTFIQRKQASQEVAFQIADLMNRLGRDWEAEGWGRLGLSLHEDLVADAREKYQTYRDKLRANTPWQRAEFSLVKQIDLSALPTWDFQHQNAITQSVSQEEQPVTFRFEDEAKERGVQYTCALRKDAKLTGNHIYETGGGGVAAIDYDLNGWPDLAFASLDGEVFKTNSSPHRLFRNEDGVFRDVTEDAHYEERGYGQGFAVADYNEDGFPDLFDANIGSNRLFRNNGDGTFTDVTDTSGLQGEGWTTSAVLVDLDGDHIVDLFEAKYCAGKRPFEQECKDHVRVLSCMPLEFEPELDHVWQGKGDGTFQEKTLDWMDQKTSGRGLGVVAGLIDELPGMDLYVANDMTSNHLWSSTFSNDRYSLTDLGVLKGLAVDFRGRAQASMGIALGDADSDGDLDLFVSHFYDDHNTFYEQIASGQWSDRSYQVGLAKPSLDKLAWGTQFIDINNDGSNEIVVANGHIDDLTHIGKAYEMVVQVFRRRSDGQWQEQEGSEIGDYFTKKRLGRSLIRADLNRDGLEDLVMTHLHEPVALLVNHSPEAGKSVGIHLVATSSARDAIGAKVMGKREGRQVQQQLVAGAGYQGANQLHVVFGMGQSEKLSDVKVHWPSGHVQELGELEVGKEYLVVENRAGAIAW